VTALVIYMWHGRGHTRCFLYPPSSLRGPSLTICYRPKALNGPEYRQVCFPRPWACRRHLRLIERWASPRHLEPPSMAQPFVHRLADQDLHGCHRALRRRCRSLRHWLAREYGGGLRCFMSEVPFVSYKTEKNIEVSASLRPSRQPRPPPLRAARPSPPEVAMPPSLEAARSQHNISQLTKTFEMPG
jgi:hypothetical protein